MLTGTIASFSMKSKLLALLLLIPSCVPNDLKAQAASPALRPLEFLSGHWTSSSKDEFSEEYWSPLVGNNIVGTFRVLQSGNPVFYEFWTIEQENGVAVFKMKHFNAGLIGWEEKTDVVRLPVKETGAQSVVFSNQDGSLILRYERHGQELVSILSRTKNGVRKDDVFHFSRQ